MKAIIAIGCVLLAVSAARGQFSIVSDERTVMARVERTIDNGIDPPYLVVDEQSGGELAEARLTEDIAATAWQTVNLGVSRLDIAGGVRDLETREGDGEARGRSELMLVFDVLTPTRANLSVTIEDPPTLYTPGAATVPGDASFALSGPHGTVASREAETGSRFDTNFGDELWLRYPPYTYDEELMLEPGQYTAHFLATGHFRVAPGGDLYPRDASYTFRLEAIPIPEPASLALAVIGLGLFALVRRYVFAHFGK
jgi:hypothetical protein